MTRWRNLTLSLMMVLGLVTGAWAERTEVSPGLYVVGIPSDQFVHFAAPEGDGRQRMANWSEGIPTTYRPGLTSVRSAQAPVTNPNTIMRERVRLRHLVM